MKSLLRVVFVTFLVSAFVLPVFAMGSELPTELLLFGEEYVVTASRYKQKVSESPSAISVITEEDIRLSGATNIPDVLRMVEGIEIMYVTATDVNVSARGFNMTPSNKMLVMIDGRSVYYEFLGFVLWDTFPISLEEIKKIEVIKGPGSVLYGANAFSGVINIITKTPNEAKGTEIYFTGGEYGTYHSSLIHANVLDKLSYKISGGWDQLNQWRDKDELEGKSARVNVATNYEFDEHRELSIQGGYSRSYNGKIMSSKEVGTQERDCQIPYMDIKYNFFDWQFRTWWRGSPDTTQTKVLGTGQEYNWPADTYNIELQHSLKIGEKNRLVYGAEGRYYKIGKGGMFEKDRKQELGAFYLQDEFTPIKQLQLVLGSRYDYNSETEAQATPRGSLIYFLDDNQQIRLSGATAFLNPNFINLYLYQDALIPYADFGIPVPGGFTVFSRGNKDLVPEKVTTYELGYQRKVNNNIKGKVDLFYNRYKDFINGGVVNFYEENELFPGSPPDAFPKLWSFANSGKIESYGGEIGVDFKITKWLKGLTNYSYQSITYLEDYSMTPQDDEGERLRMWPKHKANFGLRAMFENGFSANVIANYVGNTDYTQDGYKEESKLGSYTLVNCRVGYRFLKDSMEVAVSVYNLLDDKHYEHPSQNPNTFVPIGDELARKFTTSLSYRF